MKILDRVKLFFKKNKAILFFLVAVTCIFIVLIVIEEGKREDVVLVSDVSLPKVEIIKAKPHKLVLHFEATGKVIDNTVVMGYDRFQGKIKEVFVEKGSYVKVGEPLFCLDLTENLTSLKLEVTNLRQSIDELNVSIEQLEAKKEELNELFEYGFVNQNDIREIENQILQHETQKKGVINQRYATYSAIQSIQEYGQVIATESGYIRDISFIQGEHIGQEDYIKIEKDENPSCVIYLTEEIVEKLFVEDIIDVSVSGNIVSGKISKIEGITEAEILFPVEIELMTALKILPGTEVTAYIPIYEKTKALMVPANAVISFNGESYLYCIYEEEVAVKKNIEKGKTFNGMIEVISGIRQNEKVVVKGQFTINDGQNVDIIP